MKSVLVIEDEMDILDLVEYHLVQAGFTVLKAPDGESGLELAKTKKPALIILDIMLPKMDGKEVCRALKSNPADRMDSRLDAYGKGRRGRPHRGV